MGGAEMRRPIQGTTEMERLLQDRKTIALFVLPALLLYLAMFMYPILQTFRYSLFRWNGITAMQWLGASNYRQILTSDRHFWRGVRNTLYILVLLFTTQVPPALLIAILLNRITRGVRILKIVYFIPFLLSTVALAMMWSKIYEPNYGLLNELLAGFGLHEWQSEWLSNPDTAIWFAAIPISWQGIGFHMVVLYAAIKSIPSQYYEAALIDGATGFMAETRITIPLIADALKVCFTMAAIASLKSFDAIWVLTGGGPANSTTTVAIRMYQEAFTRNNYGYGSAIAILLLLECLIIAFFLDKLLSRERIEY